MTKIVEVNNIAYLAPYRSQWGELLAETPQATFFQSLEWLEAYWKHYGQGQQLRVLLQFDREGLTGILPLAVSTERTRVGALRVLTFPLDGWGSFYGPIGRDSESILAACMGHVAHCRRNWDVIDLRWLRSPEGEWVLTESALHRAGFEAEAEPFEELAMIRLTGSFEDYWKNFKSHERDNIRRGERKLQKQGTVEYVRYRPLGQQRQDADPRWDLYEACQQVAERSWQGNADDGTTLSNQIVRDFYRDAHEAAAAAGAIDLNLITLDGQAIAFAYNYHRGGEVYVIKMGFDAEFGKTGVGKLLLCRMIEDSYRRGDHAIDLGPESFHYKRIWMTHIETSYRAVHYAATSPRAQSLRWGRWAKGVLRRRIRDNVADVPSEASTGVLPARPNEPEASTSFH